MKRKVFIFTSLAIIIYIVLSIQKRKSVETLSDNEMQLLRKELGLELFDNNWQLDSTVFCGYGNYSLIELEYLPMWKLYFENEKLYCQYWKLNEKLSKRIFYFKSIWLWKNKIIAEADFHINQISKIEKVELSTLFDFTEKEWYCNIDTSETEYKKMRDIALRDSLDKIYPNLIPPHPDYEISYYDTAIFPLEKAREIIAKWKKEI